MRDKSFFEKRRVRELVKFSLSPVSIEPLRGLLPGLGNVYGSFARNVNRTYNLANYSQELVFAAVDLGLYAARANYEEFGTFSPTRVPKDRAESLRLRMTRVDTKPDRIPRGAALTNQVSSVFKMVLIRANDRVGEGLDALIPSLAILSWTAFESLCEDLAATAVVLRPRWLSQARGRGKLRKLRPWEVTIKGKLHRTSDHPKGPVAADRLTYRTVKAIRDSYWLLFCKGGAGIDRILNSRRVDSLFAVRNILVHRGGVVVDVFLKRVSGLAEFSQAAEGKSVSLDFGSVHKLIRPIFARGVQLIAAVNKWLVDHPDSQAP